MSTNGISVGVLDIQGSVREHLQALTKLGVNAMPVKTKQDLNKISGLIIPGGESTTIGKLIKKNGLDKEIRKRAAAFAGSKTLAVWGTCAGAILLAKKVLNDPPDGLRLMDMTIERNSYGGQLDSFETEITIPALKLRNLRAIFIRAPKIKKASPKAKILAKYEGNPVMVQQENLLATTFHPELTSDLRIHEYFISLTRKYGDRN